MILLVGWKVWVIPGFVAHAEYAINDNDSECLNWSEIQPNRLCLTSSLLLMSRS